MTEDQSSTIRLLLAVRVKHGWSQQQLAEALMVSRRTIVNWERGHLDPPAYLPSALRTLLAD